MKSCLIKPASCVIAGIELEMDLESFLVHERTKIQDECSRLAVSKVVSTNSGKKDCVQQMVDSWTNAFLQVSVHGSL